MNKTKIYVISGLSLFVLLSVFILVVNSSHSINNQPQKDNTISSVWHTQVCNGITRSNGSYESLGCSHNLVTNAGLEGIEQIIGNGANYGTMNYIGLSNASAGSLAPAAGDTTLDNEYAAGGLTRAIGTYNSNGNGNWTISKTFTATLNNLLINKTGLFNQSSAGLLFAENTFTLATLQINDQITTNWTIWDTSS